MRLLADLHLRVWGASKCLRMLLAYSVPIRCSRYLPSQTDKRQDDMIPKPFPLDGKGLEIMYAA